MSSIRIRPKFKVEHNKLPEDLLEKISQDLKNTNSACYAESLLKSFVVLKINKEEQHFWSPQLSLSIEKIAKGSLIRGLYGPRPTIWSMFVFLYTGIGVCILFAGMYGLARLSLNLSAGILWLLPILTALAVLLYLFAQAGQKFGAQQMFYLHHFIEDVLTEKIEIH